MSSIAVAGNYEGVFREDMFDEAKDYLDHPICRPSTRARPIVRALLDAVARLPSGHVPR